MFIACFCRAGEPFVERYAELDNECLACLCSQSDLPRHEEKFLLITGQILGQHKLEAGPNGANPFDTQELFDGSRLKPFEECLALSETDFQRRGRDSNPRQELPPVTP